MGVIDSLRKAEEQGRNVARRGLEKARGSWDDVEGRLRRKMRLHPRTQNTDRQPAPMPNSIHPPAATSGPAADDSLSHRASEEDAA